MHDLPVFFHVDWPIVVIIHGRIVVRLLAASVVTGLVHVRVAVCRALGWPCGRAILTVVLCSILRRRAYGLGWSRLRFGLGGWCGCGSRGLLCGLIIVAGGPLVSVALHARSYVALEILTDRRRCHPRSSRRPWCSLEEELPKGYVGNEEGASARK